MPFAYPNQPRLKLDILDRIAGGEPLTAIFADPAMPSHGSVLAWRRRDPAFATALADARRRADHIRRYAFDEAKAQVILARVRAGESSWRSCAISACPAAGSAPTGGRPRPRSRRSCGACTGFG